MIWGFATSNRGPYSLRLMLTGKSGGEPVSAVLASIISSARAGAGEGFTSLFDARGRTRVPRLGVAFGTKLVHFADYDSDARPRPLVLDNRVWLAAQALTDMPTVPDPKRYVATADYLAYCRWRRMSPLVTASSQLPSSSLCSPTVARSGRDDLRPANLRTMAAQVLSTPYPEMWMTPLVGPSR
jgi:hypothetical protein